ncbi:MAG: gamma-glutamylcyclotransferase family protein [Candidatus Binatia bacterium]
MHLFVYGTLMDQSLVTELTCQTFTTSPAVLQDFKKLVSHLGYPYVLPYPASKVNGLLIKNIDPESIKKLDRYEGEGQFYSRKKVDAVCTGEWVACEAYVGNRKTLNP